MNENPGKANKKPELLYRLDRRNPLMVMFDFIRFSFFLLVPGLLTAIYYRSWMQAWASLVLCFWVGFCTSLYFLTTLKFTEIEPS